MAVDADGSLSDMAQHLERSASMVRLLQNRLVVTVIVLCAERCKAEPAQCMDAAPHRTPAYEARALAMSVLHTGLGFSLRDVAAAMKCPRSTVHRSVERVSERRDVDAELDRWLVDLENMMQRRSVA